jgi:hypothetical protein
VTDPRPIEWCATCREQVVLLPSGYCPWCGRLVQEPDAGAESLSDDDLPTGLLRGRRQTAQRTARNHQRLGVYARVSTHRSGTA